jgi:hypothetical protein
MYVCMYFARWWWHTNIVCHPNLKLQLCFVPGYQILFAFILCYVCPICIEEQCKNGKRLWFLHGEFVKDGKVVMDKKWGQTGKYRSATQKAVSGNAMTQASLMHRSLLRNNFGTVDWLLPLTCLLMCQRNSTTIGVWRSLRSCNMRRAKDRWARVN